MSSELIVLNDTMELPGAAIMQRRGNVGKLASRCSGPLVRLVSRRLDSGWAAFLSKAFSADPRVVQW